MLKIMKKGVACSLHRGMRCRQRSIEEKQLEVENEKAHDGQSSRWDGPDVMPLKSRDVLTHHGRVRMLICRREKLVETLFIRLVEEEFPRAVVL
jgi:hypothetical protein